jgi:hypothetical protein
MKKVLKFGKGDSNGSNEQKIDSRHTLLKHGRVKTTQRGIYDLFHPVLTCMTDKETRCVSSNRKEIPANLERRENLGIRLSSIRSKCHSRRNAKEIPQILRMHGIPLHERISPSWSCIFPFEN